MSELIRGLFDTSDFPPRWYCGSWSSELGWLHIVSDLGVWSAYVAIPCVLCYYMMRKRTLPFRMLFGLFGAFILACGTTHLMEAVIFWWPAYRLAGLLKLVTAIVSWATVIALIPATPRALAMRTPEELSREISERKRAEQELELYAGRLRQTNQQLLQAEHLKSELLANVSHELRTPLTLILAPVESMLAGEYGSVSEQQSSNLRTVHNNAIRLLQMVTSLLDVSRHEAGKIEVHREPLDLISLIRSILIDFQATVERRGLSVRFDPPREEAWVRMDRYLIERILFNLLSNAVKFTPKEGAISVHLSIDADRLSLSVEDTGIGIAASDIPFLFERFRQVEGSSTRRFEGTGLGLALVKSFAELLDGTTSVHSIPGKGSTFTVECLAPACDPVAGTEPVRAVNHQLHQRFHAQPRPLIDAADPASHDEKPIVLIAEDNADLAYHIASLLQDSHHVRVAADGIDALEQCRSIQPDLVLADVMMPEIDGYTLCRLIKSDPSTAATSVILLTAITQRDAMIKGWESGADEYLHKPFHPRELITRITTMIASSRGRKRLERLREFMNAELENRVLERTAELAATQKRLQAEMAEQLRIAAERRLVERALEESEEQFHSLADSIPQLAWMARSDGSVFWCNKRWYDYTGIDSTQNVAPGWKLAFDPSGPPSALERFDQAIKDGEAWEDTIPLRRHDGTIQWHLSRAVPVHNDLNRVARWFGTHTDITDRMLMEEALKRADRLKDQYVAMLAHELRNPLAPIRSALAVLRLAATKPDVAGEALDMAERQVSHMARLLDNLLEVSRISHGKIVIERKKADLPPLVLNAVQALRPLIDERRHELSLQLPDEPLHVLGDATRLEQIINNLITNAAKYTEPGGKIRISLEVDGDDVVLSVRDNGVGITAEMLGPIFDLFVQADNSSMRLHSGVGIGLTLVRELVHLHGGTVKAMSDGVGKGSEFNVRLPLLITEPRIPAISLEEPDPLTDPPTRYRVLVVDDNVDAAVSLGMLFRLVGQDVEVAHDGAEAITRALEFKPNLILLDIGMPRMDGYEVCRRIRQEPTLEGTVVVALTGWGDEEDRRLSRAAGFDNHLVKPVDPSALQGLIDKLGPARGTGTSQNGSPDSRTNS